ncbi:hCG1818061 [Homo sapiens]|uniref:Ovarian cancer-related protein 1 n=1 Tax=Homo sapiens TaxID=9606 RepID=OCR1_HUMAN|nr:RecName: Full=Ovarian cancer-related protein 1 [Homo sapiens]AAG59813.1 ovarian cancer-related protein 1 [Homo sapiens]EAW91427.1 hCG1818061 [Homo sapiens]
MPVAPSNHCDNQCPHIFSKALVVSVAPSPPRDKPAPYTFTDVSSLCGLQKKCEGGKAMLFTLKRDRFSFLLFVSHC